MKYKFTYEKHDSKLATFLSFLQNAGLLGLLIIFTIFSIPAFICLFCGVEGVTVGALFGTALVLAILVYIFILIRVEADDVDKAMSKNNEQINKEQTREQKTEKSSGNVCLARQKLINNSSAWLLSYSYRLRCQSNFLSNRKQIEKDMNVLCAEYENKYGTLMYVIRDLEPILMTLSFELYAIGIYYIFELQYDCAKVPKDVAIERLVRILQKESPRDSSPINGTAYSAAHNLFVHDVLNFTRFYH